MDQRKRFLVIPPKPKKDGAVPLWVVIAWILFGIFILTRARYSP